ncbi:hypothetical protein DSM112329_04775 [Paraconexibacter sp. AEG42_29]|uniref:Uncharacterized protein n=1 Tax=Paraconexibacter sp. AEG42_29 TaxID=2997339 RepID=A0AAU7B1Q1_9ACTN
MPKPRGSVGFWRGDPSARVELQRPPDRWTGTLVDNWSPATIAGLRRELISQRRQKPKISDGALSSIANDWLRDREQLSHARGTGTKRKKPAKARSVSPRVTAEHVKLLLHPPAQPKRRKGASRAQPKAPQSAPRPTSLSGDEMARIVAGSAGTVRGTTNKGTESSPARPAGARVKVRIHAGIGTYGAVVAWNFIRHARSVHLVICDRDGARLHEFERAIDERHVRFPPPPGGEFTVRAMFLGESGQRLANATARHPRRNATRKSTKKTRPQRNTSRPTAN